MRRSLVMSSNIASVGYDPDAQMLEIEFNTSGVYQYRGVPLGIYQGLMSASSKGRYHALHIKDAFAYTKIG